jgi:hypothetical protein
MTGLGPRTAFKGGINREELDEIEGVEEVSAHSR